MRRIQKKTKGRTKNSAKPGIRPAHPFIPICTIFCILIGPLDLFLTFKFQNDRSRKFGAVGGRSSPFPIDKAYRLYNRLLLPHKPWSGCSRFRAAQFRATQFRKTVFNAKMAIQGHCFDVDEKPLGTTYSDRYNKFGLIYEISKGIATARSKMAIFDITLIWCPFQQTPTNIGIPNPL